MFPELHAAGGVAGAAAGVGALERDVLIADGEISAAWRIGHRNGVRAAAALQGFAPEDAQGVVPLAVEAQALVAGAALIALPLLIGREAKGPALAHQDVDVALALGELTGAGLHRNGVVMAAELAVGEGAVGPGGEPRPQAQESQEHQARAGHGSCGMGLPSNCAEAWRFCPQNNRTKKNPRGDPGGSGFLWSVNALLLGHGSGTAERCTDDGDDGKDFHG